MTARTAILLLLVGSGLAFSGAGCDSTTPATPDMVVGADVGPDSTWYPPNYDQQKRCYSDPTTHVQIINSCPTGGVALDRLEKDPQLPLLNADGSRPPLP